MTQGILWAIPLEPFYIPARHPNQPQTPHITLAYGIERDACISLLGKQFIAVLMAEFWNERVQAIGVMLPREIECANLIPHLTISWAESASPNEANTMLQGMKFANPIGSGTGLAIEFEVQFCEWEGES